MSDNKRLIQEIIWRAIDDALMPPLTKKEIQENRYSVKFFKGARGKNNGRYPTAKKNLARERTRQSGENFVMDSAFLGLYKFAFQSDGEWVQHKIKSMLESLKRNPSRSEEYRQSFRMHWTEKRKDKSMPCLRVA